MEDVSHDLQHVSTATHWSDSDQTTVHSWYFPAWWLLNCSEYSSFPHDYRTRVISFSVCVCVDVCEGNTAKWGFIMNDNNKWLSLCGIKETKAERERWLLMSDQVTSQCYYCSSMKEGKIKSVTSPQLTNTVTGDANSCVCVCFFLFKTSGSVAGSTLLCVCALMRVSHNTHTHTLLSL